MDLEDRPFRFVRISHETEMDPEIFEVNYVIQSKDIRTNQRINEESVLVLQDPTNFVLKNRILWYNSKRLFRTGIKFCGSISITQTK